MAKTIKELAQECNVSYEAIRKSVNAFLPELTGHTYKEFKTLYLDDYACEFIKSKRMQNPIIVQQTTYSEELIELKEKYVNLLECHNALQTEYREYKNNATDLLLQASNQLAVAEQSEANKKKAKELEARNLALQTEKEEADLKLEKIQKEAENANLELTRATEELQAYRNMSIFSFLKKKIKNIKE